MLLEELLGYHEQGPYFVFRLSYPADKKNDSLMSYCGSSGKDPLMFECL